MSRSAPSSSTSKSELNAVPTNPKKEAMLLMLERKKECMKEAQRIVHRFIEPNVTEELLLSSAIKINKSHFADIIEERRLSSLCGWVLCDNKLEKNDLKQKYVIRSNRVFDISLRKSFCSDSCYSVTVNFEKQIPTSPLWLRDEEDAEFFIPDGHTKPLVGDKVNITTPDS